MELMLQQKTRKKSSNMYIPTELLEKVLLNLPVKSLTRFSTVSKSWNSTIHSRDFAKRYRGREMIVMKTPSVSAFAYPLSSMPWGNPTKISPRPFPISRVSASCGELWCVGSEDGSVRLYNPSLRACRKLPASSTPTSRRLIYGLGYDSATDDYKVLRFGVKFDDNYELYSRRSDSWRTLNGLRDNIRECMSLPSHDMDFLSTKGVFANGLLCWILIIRCNGIKEFTILSFDLSTEKYGKVAMPESVTEVDLVDLGVLRGKLCVYSDGRHGRGVMWVRDEGVWTKEVVIYYYFHIFRTKEVMINYSHIFPKTHTLTRLKPLYSYNNNITAFVVTTDINGIIGKMFLYEDGSTELVAKDFRGIHDGLTYVESMVKP